MVGNLNTIEHDMNVILVMKFLIHSDKAAKHINSKHISYEVFLVPASK